WVFCKSFQDNHSQSGWDSRIDKGGRSGCIIEMLRDHSDRRITSERRHAGYHLIENDPERINIAALVARVTSTLLWRTVERCPRLRSAKSSTGNSQEFGNAEVGENRFTHRIACRIMLVQQNIRRFDIAVNHTLLVGIVNGKTYRCKKMNDLSRRWNFSPDRCAGDVILQGPAL